MHLRSKFNYHERYYAKMAAEKTHSRTEAEDFGGSSELVAAPLNLVPEETQNFIYNKNHNTTYTTYKNHCHDPAVTGHKPKLQKPELSSTHENGPCKLTRLIDEATFTKAYYKTWPFPAVPQPQSLFNLLGLAVSRLISPSNVSRSLITTFSVVSIFMFFTTSTFQSAEATLFEQSKCETFGWNAFPVWKYRAKARYVTPLKMNRRMQNEFFELFRGGDRDSSEEDSDEELNIPELHRVSQMCPKDAFFYSLSPKHLEASGIITKMFVAQPSPPEVLELAKLLIHNRHVNPKVWYHGLVGAAQERTDMTGFKLAHPFDALPDVYIPGTLLFKAMDDYRAAAAAKSKDKGRSNNATSLFARVKRSLKTIRSKKPIYTALKNDTIASTFGMIEIGNISISEDSLESESRGFTHWKKGKGDSDYDANVIKKKTKKKTKKKKKPQHTEDELFEGNATEYRADIGMWRKGDIDAFDDCVVVDGSVGKRNGIENQLWYFREDMMVNQHHWYWHQEYPLNTTMQRPRRAELFFYMHRNLIARYNAERISNGMPLVDEFDIRPGAEIGSAYNSYLADVRSGKFWTPRPPHIPLTDVIHEKDPDFERNIFIDRYNEIYGRLLRSIEVGHLLTGPYSTMNIRNTKGIQPLAHTVEATELSVNPLFYDAMGFHNLGHQIIGLQSDPFFKSRVPTGVMADTATTMRDPEFYTYHAVVDNLFDRYKKSLPPYQPRGGEYPLRWDGVEILDVSVISQKKGPLNQLRTFWSTRRFELSPGVDQSIHKGDVDLDICAVHLNHEPFQYKITVTLDPCAHTKSNKGTVRIFLAPRYNEHGLRLSMKAQRRLMIQMDAFPVDLRVGRNVIFRSSLESNVAKPWSKSISEYLDSEDDPTNADFCGCGWPLHLLIPKGTHKGLPFDLFAMITNFDEDYVEENPDDLYIPEPCNSPYIYCGIPWRKYPDARPMGYPFDRSPPKVPIECPPGMGSVLTLLCRFFRLFWYTKVHTLEEYVKIAPNMAATVVEIKHFDKLVW